jgi:DNA repair protein RadC
METTQTPPLQWIPLQPEKLEEFRTPPLEVNTAEKAYQHLRKWMSLDAEELWALALDPKKRLIDRKMIFRGTVDACLVHPRDIFRFGCMTNASALIVAHNHPSGDRKPSEQDLIFTQQLLRAARVVQIPVVDHLILTSSGFASFANEGWCGFETMS